MLSKQTTVSLTVFDIQGNVGWIGKLQPLVVGPIMLSNMDFLFVV